MISSSSTTRQWALIVGAIFATRCAIAQTPSVVLLVAAQGKQPGENALLLINPATKTVEARIPLGGQPHNVAVSPDGKTAFTTNAVRDIDVLNFPGVPRKANAPDPLPSDTLSVIDLQARKEVRLVDLGPGADPHGIYFAAGKVYFTCEGYKLVGRYDPVHQRVDWMGGIGQNRGHEVVVTGDGKKLFIANIGSDSVTAIAPWDPATDAQKFVARTPAWNMTAIPAAIGTEGIAMTPDEKEVWALNRGSHNASIIDVATRKLLLNMDLNTDDPLRIGFTPDATRALVSDAKSGDVILYDTKARKEIQRIKNVGTQIHGIAVAPDNSTAYLAVQGSGDIAVVDLKTFRITARVPTGTGSKPFDGIDGMTMMLRK